MKSILIVGMAGLLVAGCGKPFDETPVKVRIVTVWTQQDYDGANKWSVMYPHVVVERLDTLERIQLRGDTWGRTGDVFAVKQCNLRW